MKHPVEASITKNKTQLFPGLVAASPRGVNMVIGPLYVNIQVVPKVGFFVLKEAYSNNGFLAAIEKKIRGHLTEKSSENCLNMNI